MRTAAAVALSALPAIAATCPQAPVPGKPLHEAPADQKRPARPPVFEQLGAESGKVQVADLATIDLPAGWGYLQQKQARHLVEQVWHNPPNPGVLGMVLPADFADSKWGIVVEYESEGHVDDSDAAGIDYNDLLKQMQSGVHEANAERRKRGYPTAELVGWAEPPHYDAAQKKLYWAKALRFEHAPADTLNYNVRVLGREGTLVMNAVAAMDQLRVVAAGCKDVLAVTGFQTGKRYGDFDSKIDKVAAYGIGGLIAGGVLLKTGILAKLSILLLKFLKPLLVGVAIIVGFVARVLGIKKKKGAAAATGTGTGGSAT